MKIINVDINDEIIFKNVVDVDTGVVTGISSGVKLPTGNYNNIILNFSFANQKLCDNFNNFASFKINNGKPIVRELKPITIGNITYASACDIPNEVFQDKCEVTLGVYGYLLNEDGTLNKRFSLVPVRNFVIEGSYDPDSTEGTVPSPTVFEIYFDKIETATDTLESMMNEFLEYYKKYESTYITTSANETVIPVNIPVLNSATLLLVFINELYVPASNYTIDYTTRKIKLSTAIATVGTKINFVCLKTVVANTEDYSLLKGEKGDKGEGFIDAQTLEGQEIEVEAPLKMESILHISGNSVQDGEASPNNEVLIQSVKSKSDNLFDMGATPLKNSDTTVETNNNTIKVVATTTKQNTASYFSIPNNESLLGETITFSTEIKESNQNLGRAILSFLDSENNWISNIARLNSGEKSITVTVPSEFVSGATKIGVLLYANTNGTSQVGDYVTYTNIMLNKGTVALPYQPYGYVPAEVKVEGKNNIFNGTLTQEGINISDGTTYFESSVYVCSRDYIDVRGISEVVLGSSKNKYATYFVLQYDKNKNYIGNFSKTSSSITVTLIENTEYIRVEVGNTQEPVTIENLGNFIITSTKTISLPLGDIELRSTPDGTRDTFARVDGVWNKVEYAPSTIFDGVNVKFESKSGSTANTIWMSTATYEVENRAIVMCNRFNGNSGDLYSRDGLGVYAENKRLKFAFGLNSELTTLELANEWLKNNPLKIVYPVKTPTYTPITDQALINALDELEQLILHKGYNRITVTAVNGVKAYLDLSIPSTASVTEVIETDSSQDLIVPVVSGEGNVKVKIPADNKMTLNPTTGEVNVKALKIDGVDITTFIEQVVANLGT